MMNQEQVKIFNYLKKLAIDTIVNDETSFECRFDDSKVIEFDFYTRDNENRICLTYEEVDNDCESQSTYSLSEFCYYDLLRILKNVKSFDLV